MKIFNTLTNKKDELRPIKGKKINLFVCGPTVYDYSHLGHGKNFIAFDIFVKYLRSKGYTVHYIQNITDLDDKIIARAREKGVSPKDLAMAFEKEYLADMKKLGINSVNKYPRATSYIKEIISQVKRLQDKGFAYEISGDGIYYNIAKFKNYGKLAGRTTSEAEDGVSRIDYSKDKKNRGDFCLWKFTQMEGEPSWKSSFGDGRPGWHIEDTAITEKFFGPQYDIHGGARDLIFPHHEAEVSQMEAISGKRPMAKYWMHVGFLTVNGQKMSKSLGNFITMRDFFMNHEPRHLRLFVAKNLWRSPVDYSESAMVEVKTILDRLEDFLRKIKSASAPIKTLADKKTNSEQKKLIKAFKDNFYKELDDDFNTPKAFAVMFDFMKTLNPLLEQNLVSTKSGKEIYKIFEEINKIFGIIDFKKLKAGVPAEIKELAKQRDIARQNKDWQKSDALRKEIEKQGFAVEDTKTGTVVKSKF